jgi:two-component system, cell cycle response regulator DivK
MKVLIVEDNSDMRDLLSLVIERLYYVPVLAGNGKECSEKAIAEKPQLILMDMMMPVMDGWEAARVVRANPETKNIPILATTALCRPHELKTCLEAGCNDYIVKPFSFLDLETKIRELLGTSSEQLATQRNVLKARDSLRPYSTSATASAQCCLAASKSTMASS